MCEGGGDLNRSVRCFCRSSMCSAQCNHHTAYHHKAFSRIQCDMVNSDVLGQYNMLCKTMNLGCLLSIEYISLVWCRQHDTVSAK